MKTLPISRHSLLFPVVVLTCAAISACAPRATAKMQKVVFEDEPPFLGGSSGPRTLKIQVEAEHDKTPKEVAWLGVSTEETSDALAAQLGLQPGDGLLVAFVQPDSPAARAGLQKNDVLVEMGDQLLVHPSQFRKLVRRQKEGDKINLTLFRSGKKQSVSATLTKTTERASNPEEHEFQVQLSDPRVSEAIREHLKALSRETSGVGPGERAISAPPYGSLVKQVNMEVQLGMEQARTAINEALVRNRSFAQALGPNAMELEELTRGNLHAGGKTTVTVKKNAKSIKTIVKAEETGTFVIVANPKKHLTVHDTDGKLLFDGEIETPEQQQKVPAELWSKAQEMLEEIGPGTDDETIPKARSAEPQKQ